MGIVIKFDEDILELKTQPSLLVRMIFWKKWSYRLEVPVNRIQRIDIKRRFFVLTAYVVVNFSQKKRVIPFCLSRANRKQLELLQLFTDPTVIKNYFQETKLNSKRTNNTKKENWREPHLKTA